MDMASKRELFGTVRSLLLALTAIAGLMLCLTVMHGLHAEHSERAVSVVSIAPAGNAHASTSPVDGVPGGTIVCDAPCESGHLMAASPCAIALVAPLLLIGTTRSTAAWGPFQRRMHCLVQRVGKVSSPKPPSLLFLSISRT